MAFPLMVPEEFFSGKLDVAQDGPQEAGTENLASVYRNRRSPTVLVTWKKVATGLRTTSKPRFSRMRISSFPFRRGRRVIRKSAESRQVPWRRNRARPRRKAQLPREPSSSGYPDSWLAYGSPEVPEQSPPRNFLRRVRSQPYICEVISQCDFNTALRAAIASAHVVVPHSL